MARHTSSIGGARQSVLSATDVGLSGTAKRRARVYARGIEVVNAAYQWIDLVPKGRDEAEIGGMGWLRRRDEYGR